MKTDTVNVALLKSGLSHYLDEVRSGNEIVVVSHRHPVARIVPFANENPLRIRRATRPASTLQKLRGITPLHPCDPVALLMEDRRSR